LRSGEILTTSQANGFGRFVAPVAAAGILGGILAAAAEYMLGALLGEGAFWGEPRFIYQLSFSGECLWLALLGGLAFALAASVYYWLFPGKRAARLASPARLAVLTAALGTPAFYFLASVDVSWFLGKPRIIVVAAFAAVAAAWLGGIWGLYVLLARVRRRRPSKQVPVYVMRAVALGLLVPFVVAEGWALWRARTPAPRRPDIYLVIMDALRADRLSFYGAERQLAPAWEKFGREGVVFRDAFTVSSWTKPAVASVFTGIYPGAHGANARFYGLPAEAVTLAEVLRRGGYRTIAVSANPNVCRGAGMAAGFDVMDYTAKGPVLYGAGPPVSWARPFRVFPWARRFWGPLWKTTLDGVEINRRVEFYRRAAGDRPTFFYVHYMETHTPNPPRPEYRDELAPYLAKVSKRRAAHIAAGPFFWNGVLEDPTFAPDFTPDELALAKALYDADVRRADVVIKDFLDNVVGSSDSERGTVVVLTSDHGEEFLEHGRWLHGAGLHHEVARIPLMVKAPDCGAAVVTGPVNLVDVAPTLASFAGCAAPDGWDGTDLGPYLRRGTDVPRRELPLEGIHILKPPPAEGLSAALELNALVDGGYYYLKDENAGTEFLYDRGNDPGQEYNLAGAAAGSEAAGLLARERELMAEAKKEVAAGAFRQEEVRLSPELQRQLRAFGYVK
jgi:arylsulfatase A-like enzyme